MDTPDISVITVCRNPGDAMRRTLESVLGHDHPSFEWIVVDGASSDGTAEWLAAQVKQIGKFLSEPDRGIYDAMNKGIRMAVGRYCLFLNGGDRFIGRHALRDLQRGVGDADIVYGDMAFSGRQGTEVRTFRGAVVNEHFLYDTTLPHGSTMIRRELFRSLGPYDESFRIAADHEFFVRALRRGASFQYVPVVVTEFFLDGVSSLPENRSVIRAETARLRRMHYPWRYRLYRGIRDWTRRRKKGR